MGVLTYELTEADLRKLVADHIESTLGFHIEPASINIETKSKQNYRAEWETAAFRVTVRQPT